MIQLHGKRALVKIEWGINDGRAAAAVIPTADTNQNRVQSLIAELDSNGVDSLCVEDKLPEFRFARSMNRGIEELLKHGKIRCIVLSNDDISDIKGMADMLQIVAQNQNIYARPHTNGENSACIVTTSRLKLIWNYSVAKKAPFYAFRIVNGLNWYGKHHLAVTAPTFKWKSGSFVNVQPFGVFNAAVFRDNKFDENFQNGIEDLELGYRLMLAGVKGMARPEWNVRHGGSSSFKEARNLVKNCIGSYSPSDQELIRGFEYFWEKHFSGADPSVISDTRERKVI